MRLTDKDILLLKLAVSVLIVFLMVRFLIMPGIEAYQENKIEGQELDASIEEMQTAIDEIPGLEQEIEVRKGELTNISAKYYERMENRQVDELLTGLALKSGLFPVSLSIGEAQAEIPNAYIYGRNSKETVDAAAENTSAAEAKEETGEANNPEDEEETSQAGLVAGGYILTVNCTMVLQGSSDQVYQFMDDIAHNYPAIQIRTMHVNERTYLDTEWNLVEQPEVSFELSVYMYDSIS